MTKRTPAREEAMAFIKAPKRISKNTITARQRFMVSLLLNEHCHPAAAGTCKYEHGWSDARVAEESGLDPVKNLKSVQNLRNEVLGKLEVSRPLTLEQLRDQLTDLTIRHNQLCEALARETGFDIYARFALKGEENAQ
jgi:hypothetical protein